MKEYMCQDDILQKSETYQEPTRRGIDGDIFHSLNMLSVSGNVELDTEKMFNVISLLWVNNWPQWLGGFLGFYPG